MTSGIAFREGKRVYVFLVDDFDHRGRKGRTTSRLMTLGTAYEEEAGGEW
jgi:hypothetical protein